MKTKKALQEKKIIKWGGIVIHYEQMEQVSLLKTRSDSTATPSLNNVAHVLVKEASTVAIYNIHKEKKTLFIRGTGFLS